MALSHARLKSLKVLPFNPLRMLAVGGVMTGGTLLSGCTILGHSIDDGIWFPVLLVVAFIGFLVWRISAVSSRRDPNGASDNASYFDSGADGHAGHHHYLDGNGGDGGGDGGDGGSSSSN
jgi:hypothetical protein